MRKMSIGSGSDVFELTTEQDSQLYVFLELKDDLSYSLSMAGKHGAQ